MSQQFPVIENLIHLNHAAVGPWPQCTADIVKSFAQENAHSGSLHYLKWLKTEINQVWENRAAITPCYTGKTKPKLMEILRLLPKTNCRKCGHPTCMVFAAQVMDGGRGVDHCPELNDENRTKLSGYLEGFVFE